VLSYLNFVAFSIPYQEFIAYALFADFGSPLFSFIHTLLEVICFFYQLIPIFCNLAVSPLAPLYHYFPS
jgi:hypothetical protein